MKNFISVILAMLLVCGQLNAQSDTVVFDHVLPEKPAVIELNYSPLVYRDAVDVVVRLDHMEGVRQEELNLLVTDTRRRVVAKITIGVRQVYTVARGLKHGEVYQVSGEQDDIQIRNAELIAAHGQEFTVSKGLLDGLKDWAKRGRVKMADALLDLRDRVHTLELASFIQHHYRIPELEIGREDDLLSLVPVWPPKGGPTGPGGGGGGGDDCLCSFVLNTDRNVNPGEELAQPSDTWPWNGVTIQPESVVQYEGSPEETNYALVGNGAAKIMSLRMKGKHGSGEWRGSTTGIGSDAPGGSPFFSRIAYNMFCSGYGSDLPEECACEKEVYVDYHYTTHMRTFVSNGGGLWIWSSGGEATAEDFALLTVVNGDEATIVDAGRARIATHCESNWNVDWWTNFATLLASTVGVVVDTNSTIANYADLGSQLVDVLTTSFFVGEGNCENMDEVGTLIEGGTHVTLRPNQPVEFILASFGTTYVRGYGKWTTSTRMISDYHLTTVFLGDDFEDEACCMPKVGDYYVGYFDDWLLNGVTVYNGSVNSGEAVRDEAASLFNLWGPFSELETDFTGDYVLTNDYGHFVEESENCDGNEIGPDAGLMEISGLWEEHQDTEEGRLKLFPNPVYHLLQVEATGNYEIIDVDGRKVLDGVQDEGWIQIDVSDLGPGTYVLRIRQGLETRSRTFIKQ